MLVDGGNRDDGPMLVEALTELGVERLTYAVCTHPHEDHAGGLAYVTNRIPMDQAWAPCRVSDNIWFSDFAAVAESGCGLTLPRAGEEYPLDELGEARVQVLGPLREYEDVNDSSLILRIVYRETAFLLTGDATWVAESDLVEAGVTLYCDLLKVGHHGANSSSSYVFLREAAPEFAVISVGADNAHGHPGDYALERLADAGATVLRTDELGTVVCRSDGKRLTFGAAVPDRQ